MYIFVYTLPRTDPRKVYPNLNDIDTLIARSAAGETRENRTSAINALAQMKSKAAIAAIEKILQYDSDEEVRKEAAGALGRIGEQKRFQSCSIF